MPRAWLSIKTKPEYRRDAVERGLESLGYEILPGDPVQPYLRDDLFVSWNKKGRNEHNITNMKKAGAKAIVMENGYLGKDEEDRQLYAMALFGHNGSGIWRVGGSSRWWSLGIDLTRWQCNENGHVLVLGQRGIGSSDMRSPPNYGDGAVRKLRSMTRRRVVHRRHPGLRIGAPETTLEEDLEGAWAVVTWASNAATKCLVAGYPVFYEAPNHIVAKASKRGLEDLENPRIVDRVPAMIDLSWAQWKVSEIESGEAFRWLLG